LPISDRSSKLAILIDGANLHATTKALGFDIDYKRLLQEFRSRDFGAFYVTMLTEDQEFSSIRPLIDWLDYNGYTVITKTIKEFVDPVGRRKLKGNMKRRIGNPGHGARSVHDHLSYSRAMRQRRDRD
jgi:uncharacterized LabA/DUF88 family protein